MANTAARQANEVPFRTVRFDILLAGAQNDVGAARQTIVTALGEAPADTPYEPLPGRLASLGNGMLLGPWEGVVREEDPDATVVRALSVVTPLKMSAWLSDWATQHPHVVMVILGRVQRQSLGFTATQKVAFIAVALPDPSLPMFFHGAMSVSQAKKGPHREGWGQARTSFRAKQWLLEDMLSPMLDSDFMRSWCRSRSLDRSLVSTPLRPSRRF